MYTFTSVTIHSLTLETIYTIRSWLTETIHDLTLEAIDITQALSTKNDQSVVMRGQVNANTCTQTVGRERICFETRRDELERMKGVCWKEDPQLENNKIPNTTISFTFDSDTPVTRK